MEKTNRKKTDSLNLANCKMQLIIEGGQFGGQRKLQALIQVISKFML